MAIILQENKTFPNPMDTQETLSYVYIVIDDILNYSKKDLSVSLRLDIYRRQCTKDERSDRQILPLSSYTYTITGDEFDTMFTCVEIDEHGNPFKMAYAYILQNIQLFENCESDEN